VRLTNQTCRRTFSLCSTTGLCCCLSHIEIDYLIAGCRTLPQIIVTSQMVALCRNLPVICRKYAFPHSAAPNFSKFLSRSPFLVAYIMKTFFTLMAAQIFECRNAREVFGGARPKIPLALT
jgi:hypothetical protein